MIFKSNGPFKKLNYQTDKTVDEINDNNSGENRIQE